MIRSLFGKLFTFTSFIICIGIALLVSLFSIVSAQAWNNERLSVLEKNIDAICKTYKTSISSNDSFEIEKIANSLSDAYDVTVFFVNESGNTYACTDIYNHKNCVHLESTVSSSIIKSVKNKDVFKETGTFGGMYNKKHHTVGSMLRDYSGESHGMVFVSISTDSVTNYTVQIITSSIIIGVFIVLALTIFIYVLSKGMLAPIHQMTDAAKAISKGDFSRRVPVGRSKDEINELSASFNAMATSFESLEKMSNSFISNVSHELKTPMTTIGGFIDGILNGTIPPERESHYLNIVSDEIKRLSSVVNSMLALSKLESGQTSLTFAKTDIVDIIFKVIISFESKLEDKEIQVIGLEDIDRIYIDCDSELMHQVIYNLFDNAVKYTPVGGYISIFINEYNSRIELYIKNSGDGIGDEDINYIFDRFYKIDKSRSVDKTGFGLGLHIVKSIISYHNGDIYVKSIPGQYTQFCVTLPVKHAVGDNNETK